MTGVEPLPPDSAEELFETAPCSYLATRIDGTIVRVNRTFEDWCGRRREDLLGTTRFKDLLPPGARIYHETHFAPLLLMQGAVREVALDVLHADGRRLPALANAVVHTEAATDRQLIRITLFDASDRRRYEQELVRAQKREHEIALELQRSLLGGELPRDARVAVEVVYRPAVRGLEVGGDWYDAFWLDQPGILAVAVGDVVGRGIGAAATMGQLRSALRALASTGLSPAALLESLDRYAARHEIGRMTTLAYADVDLDTGSVRYACAGHPPPVIVPADGPARLAWEGRSLPLDVHTGLSREEAASALAPGDVMMLYTDGLVERRGVPLDRSVSDLLTAIDAVRDDEQPLVDAVADRLLGRGARDDDVCVLTVRRSD